MKPIFSTKKIKTEIEIRSLAEEGFTISKKDIEETKKFFKMYVKKEYREFVRKNPERYRSLYVRKCEIRKRFFSNMLNEITGVSFNVISW